MPGPIHVPFNPDNATIDDIGWLWFEERWLLVTFFEDLQEFRIALIEPSYRPDDFQWQDAELYRGCPYIPTSRPTSEPGESDLLEIRVSLPGGASVSASYGTPDGAERARAAVMGAISSAHPHWKAKEK